MGVTINLIQPFCNSYNAYEARSTSLCFAANMVVFFLIFAK
jgi:hypothetical protein